MAFTVTVQPRSSKPSKRFPLTVELPASQPTVHDLKRAIASHAKVRFHPLPLGEGAKGLTRLECVMQLDVNRQRITTVDKKVVLENDDQLLTDLGVKSGDRLEIKDLGPQIGALYLLS